METSTATRRRPQLTTRRRVLLAMDEAGMNDKDLADALDVNRKTIYNWLHADTIRRQHLYAIAVATGVDPVWLEHGDDTPSPDPDIPTAIHGYAGNTTSDDVIPLNGWTKSKRRVTVPRLIAA